MDPQVTFILWYKATRKGNQESINELSIAYNEWIARGGFKALDFLDRPVIRVDVSGMYKVLDRGEQWIKV